MGKDLPDLKVDAAHLDLLDSEETREALANVETEEKRVIKVSLVFLDYLDLQANKEMLVFPDNLDLRVFAEKLDPVVFLVPMVLKVLWDLLVHVVHLVLTDLRDLKETPDPQDLQDHLVNLSTTQHLLQATTRDQAPRTINPYPTKALSPRTWRSC